MKLNVDFRGPELTGHRDNLTGSVVIIEGKKVELIVNKIVTDIYPDTNAGLEVYFLKDDGDFYKSRMYRFNYQKDWGIIPKKYIPYVAELMQEHIERFGGND